MRMCMLAFTAVWFPSCHMQLRSGVELAKNEQPWLFNTGRLRNDQAIDVVQRVYLTMKQLIAPLLPQSNIPNSQQPTGQFTNLQAAKCGGTVLLFFPCIGFQGNIKCIWKRQSVQLAYNMQWKLVKKIIKICTHCLILAVGLRIHVYNKQVNFDKSTKAP